MDKGTAAAALLACWLLSVFGSEQRPALGCDLRRPTHALDAVLRSELGPWVLPKAQHLRSVPEAALPGASKARILSKVNK